MRDIRELQQALDDHAALAPDGAGLVAAAQVAAARIRRRQRIAYGVAALAVTALVAVTGAVPRLLAAATPNESAAGPRGELQLTVSLAKNSGYQVESSGTDRNRQVVLVKREGRIGDMWTGDVQVFDPGTFDAAPLLRGEKVTVRGHTAYFVPDLLVSRDGQTLFGWFGNDSRAPAVGWQDRLGAWVVVFISTDGPPDRESLLRLAEAVRVGQARDIVLPYHLRFVPDGLPVSYANVRNDDGAGSILAFGVDPTPPIQPAATSLQPPLNVQAQLLDRSRLARYGPPTHKIAGYDAWYLDGHLVSSETDTLLIVAAGNCSVEITVADQKRVTFDELKRMVERAEFKDCADRSTWTAPLP